jgi:hypothetical protein
MNKNVFNEEFTKVKNNKLSRCAFFVEKCIPFTNRTLSGPSEAPNQKWHKRSCT